MKKREWFDNECPHSKIENTWYSRRAGVIVSWGFKLFEIWKKNTHDN